MQQITAIDRNNADADTQIANVWENQPDQAKNELWITASQANRHIIYNNASVAGRAYILRKLYGIDETSFTEPINYELIYSNPSFEKRTDILYELYGVDGRTDILHKLYGIDKTSETIKTNKVKAAKIKYERKWYAQAMAEFKSPSGTLNTTFGQLWPHLNIETRVHLLSELNTREWRITVNTLKKTLPEDQEDQWKRRVCTTGISIEAANVELAKEQLFREGRSMTLAQPTDTIRFIVNHSDVPGVNSALHWVQQNKPDLFYDALRDSSSLLSFLENLYSTLNSNDPVEVRFKTHLLGDGRALSEYHRENVRLDKLLTTLLLQKPPHPALEQALQQPIRYKAMYTLYSQLQQSLTTLIQNKAPQEIINLERSYLSTVLIENSKLASLSNKDKAKLEQSPFIRKILADHTSLHDALKLTNEFKVLTEDEKL